jgi:hypothetical protein
MGYYVSTYIKKRFLSSGIVISVLRNVSISGLELQKKWENLRLAFVREVAKLKMLKSGQGAEQRSKYPYYDVLSFMLPVISNKE